MLTTLPSQRTLALWRSRLGSALRTALACVLIACAKFYCPDRLSRHITLPAFSYVTAILIVTEATVGEALRGVVFAAYGTAQGACPAILSLWLIGPDQLSITTTVLAVTVSAFVVALPASTHVIAKRIALGQIVLVYLFAYVHCVRTNVIMHPVDVAISTAVGALASVLALLLPYPRLAFYEVKVKSKLYTEIAAEKLKLLVNAFCAENKTLAIALISQAKSLDGTGKKLIQSIKIKQECIQWERPAMNSSLAHFRKPSNQLQMIEMLLKGMETALAYCPTFPIKIADQRLKDNLLQLTEEINQTLKKLDSSQRSDSCTAPAPDSSMFHIQPLQVAFPTRQDLPSVFFLFCMKLLHDKSGTSQSMKFTLEKNATQTEEIQNSKKQDSITMKRIPSLLPIRISSQRFMAAFKCSLTLGLSVLFGLLYSKNNGFWAGLAVAITVNPTREATFKTANAKIQGTVLGSVYGILGCLIAQKSMKLRFLVLLPWIIFTSFLRTSKMYGQAGAISATIGAILVMGLKDYGPENEFAIFRITENSIALLCSIVVELLLQPTRGSTLAKFQLSESLKTLNNCVGSMAFKTHANNHFVNLIELKEKEKKLREHVCALGKLIEEAEAEPSFWFVPFPCACYRRLLASLSKIADLLLFGIHGMEFLMHGYHLFGETAWKDMQEHMNGDLEHFKKVVCTPMKCFEDITRMKSLALLEMQFKKAMMKNKETGNDIEIGKSSTDEFWDLSCDDEKIEKILDSFLRNAKVSLERVGADEEEERKRCLVLGIGAMGVCMEGLMKETKEIEKEVRQLVQSENPSCHVNLHEIFFKLNVVCT